MLILIRIYYYLFLLSFLFSCSEYKKDTFSTGFPSLPEAFNPLSVNEVHEGVILNNICGKLFKTDSSLNLVPDIIKEWRLSKDKVKYTFSIDKERYFESGNKLTTKDIFFTFKNAAQNNSAAFKLLQNIKGMGPECLNSKSCIPSGFIYHGPKLFSLRVKSPNSRFIHSLTHESFCVLSKDKPFLRKGKYKVPNSSGVFDIGSITKKKIILTRKVQSSEFINKIVIKHIPQNEALNAFNEKIIDDLTFYYFSKDDSKQLKRSFRKIQHLYFFNWTIFFNIQSENLTSKRFRIIARNKFPYELFNNDWSPQNIPATGIVPYGFLETRKKKEALPTQNLSRDKECIRPLKLFSIKGINNEEKYKELFISWGDSIGCKIEVYPVDINTFEHKKSNGKGDIFFYGHSIRYADSALFFDVFNTSSSRNTLGYANAKFDRLYDGLTENFDFKRKMHTIYQLEEIVFKESWAIPINSPLVNFYTSDFYKGIILSPLSMAFTDFSKIRNIR